MSTHWLISQLHIDHPEAREAINWARNTARRYPPGVGVTVQAQNSHGQNVTITFSQDEAGKLHMRTRRNG